MTRMTELTTRTERASYRAVKRACYAGLGSLELRQAVARHASAAIPTEGCSLVTTDPETGLFTHGWMQALPDRFVATYMNEFYPDEAATYVDLVRSGVVTWTGASDEFAELLRTEGLAYRARTALSFGGNLWGSWCMFRERSSTAFGEREKRFMRAVAPHVARGIRSAAAIDAARSADGSRPGDPAVLVLDGRHRILLRSGPSREWLADLAVVGVDPKLMPYAVTSLLTHLHAVGGGVEVGGVALRAQGSSGRWYSLRAAFSEPDQSGESRIVATIEPATHQRGTADLKALYGLTDREHQVLRRVLRGETTKGISSRLRISVHTVQSHVDRACEKVGVRGRRALLAKLLADGYTNPAD